MKKLVLLSAIFGLVVFSVPAGASILAVDINSLTLHTGLYGIDFDYYNYWLAYSDDHANNLPDPSAVSDAANSDVSRTAWLYTRALPVHEPSSMLLLGAGLICLAGVTRKKLKK